MFIFIFIPLIPETPSIIHLHSTMFIFIFCGRKIILLCEVNLHSTMFIFIYFYITIITVFFCIYIPLCLYLYAFLKKLTLIPYVFTFHYVYIYIEYCLQKCVAFLKFTFHYVYIYINQPRIISLVRLMIYIPLCLYLYTQPLPGSGDFLIYLHSTMFIFIY